MWKTRRLIICAFSIAISAAFQPQTFMAISKAKRIQAASLTTEELKRFINPSLPLFQKQCRKQSARMMSLMTSDVQEETASVALSKRSLASSYVISMEDDDASKDSFIWRCCPISDEVVADHRLDEGIGERAIGAMKAKLDPAERGGFKLKCTILDEGPLVEMETDTGRDNGALIAVLSRVMAQSAFKELSDLENIKITVPSADDPSLLITEFYPAQELMSPSGYAPLFSSLLPPDVDLETMEMSDMVNGDGHPIGYIPRPLVHKFNLLHRGIGIVVCRDAHITNDQIMLPEIYVHRRTDTKRIFPSLYDMFVGGVATAGESLKLTAAREVGEELGLTRPSLSDELFKCIVCTSYNRCVVTVYTYEFDSGLDRISWQEEEVQWGDFVSYDVVEKSGALSIDRLRQKNQWPGRNGDALEVRIRTLMKENEGRQEDKWDYVPDGLLVWMAWIDWLSR